VAGDWIKMRVALRDDPSVIGVAEATSLDEDTVVGKLHRLWSWADQHTTDGRAAGITPRWVDKYLGFTGISDALVSAGWLVFEPGYMILPAFDKHNGSSAKSRAENTIRQRASRGRHARVTTRSLIPRPFMTVVFERDNFSCVYCNSDRDLSVDHLIPESRGGKSVVENLACCCRACNLEKSDRTPEEWDLLPSFLGERCIYKDGQIITIAAVTRKA